MKTLNPGLFVKISVIILRILQIYGLISLFKKEKKNIWIGLLFILFMISLIFPTVGVGNFRYRLPIEPILILLSIIGIKNLTLLKKIKPAATYSPKS